MLLLSYSKQIVSKRTDLYSHVSLKVLEVLQYVRIGLYCRQLPLSDSILGFYFKLGKCSKLRTCSVCHPLERLVLYDFIFGSILCNEQCK